MIEEFVNWATTRKLHNVLAVKPVNLEEIKAVVKAAAKNKVCHLTLFFNIPNSKVTLDLYLDFRLSAEVP